MKRWKIDFFRDDVGDEPVRDWLDGLSDEVRGKVLARIDLLAEHGPMLDFPFTSQVQDRLRELRLRFGKARYRVLYFFDEERTGVLLHGLTKDTDKLEEGNKQTARTRMEAHSRRLETARVRRTRTAGKKSTK
jgi:hypothetical protein